MNKSQNGIKKYVVAYIIVIYSVDPLWNEKNNFHSLKQWVKLQQVQLLFRFYLSRITFRFNISNILMWLTIIFI